LENSDKFKDDVESIGKIPIVKNLLDVICQTTGMGFAAIARVTEQHWVACSVRDDISFGLKPGGELEIKTTICNEIRHHRHPVVIDHVSQNELYKNHHTPAMYGFESYISVPIIKRDKTFFGTLCAIDPRPNKLETPEIIAMFHLFADLISFHLEAVEKLQSSEDELRTQIGFANVLEEKIRQRTKELEYQNEVLQKTNKELQEFNYISSHDLQEPLRKIQTFVSRLQESEAENLSEAGKNYFDKIQDSANRMRTLINDLLSYSQTERQERKFQYTDLEHVVREVMEDLKEEIQQKNARVEISNSCRANVVPFQFRQLFFNLIGNSLKYSSAERQPLIKIDFSIAKGVHIDQTLQPLEDYCRIRMSDNGIGFDSQYSEKIFELFQRLHNKTEYSGTGIGLAIAKKIVENHNGSISASGVLDRGAEISIHFPANQ
jgi:signal transduction histidine kinase